MPDQTFLTELAQQLRAPRAVPWPRYELDGEAVATRKAYGEALAALGTARPEVVALDGEVSYDFVRMAVVSRANIRLCGSHAGVAIGEDGPSHMGLEDFASLRAVHGSAVLHPCDPNQAVVRGGDGRDDVTLAGCGVTVHEALRAADRLEADGIHARVLDLYSIKPLGGEALWAAASEKAGIVVAEDHWPQGGLGEAVLSALASEGSQAQVITLGVREMPGSGKPAELLHAAGIDADAIAGAAGRLLSARATAGRAH
jgi:transketolase